MSSLVKSKNRKGTQVPRVGLRTFDLIRSSVIKMARDPEGGKGSEKVVGRGNSGRLSRLRASRLLIRVTRCFYCVLCMRPLRLSRDASGDKMLIQPLRLFTLHSDSPSQSLENVKMTMNLEVTWNMKSETEYLCRNGMEITQP